VTVKDLHGLTISTSSADASAAADRALSSFLRFRLDAREHLSHSLAIDPELALAHCVKGYFAMLLYKQASVPAAAQSARTARTLVANATQREQAHVEALEAWVAGDLDRTLATWEAILAGYPTDVLALWLAHLKYFWLGRPQDMLASVERVFPQWGRDLPGYGTILSCRCFASEECGDYATAEPAGRAAIDLDPADLWGTHAVAHVMEMQGRHDEGIAWLRDLERHWDGGNNLLHHLWWHRALFHLERCEFDEVLDLYDHRFRDLKSSLVQAQPDFHIDIQNAVSMLFRLERHEVPVGDRWTELADKAEKRIGDCLSPFTLPHWMMALAATSRDDAARRMIEAMRAFSRGSETIASIVGGVALPVCEAVLAHRRGEYSRALELMRPVLDDMDCLGGSHAQQDVLNQLFLDSAVRAQRADDVHLILARVRDQHGMPQTERVGYADAAHRFYSHGNQGH
jgi:tetratricopeptide (TPR) repeat protein